MEELIKREDVLNVLKRCKDRLQGNGLTYDIMLDMVERIPTADRPNGEWEYVHKGKWMFRRCSCCKWTQTYDDSKYMGYRYNFCPHCGAGMKGATDE